MNSKTIQDKHLIKTTAEEDRPVLDFLEKLNPAAGQKYLEAGAGDGRFALLIKKIFAGLDVHCLEINKILNEKLRVQELNSIAGNVCAIPFATDYFDIVHCSHVIEHLNFPQITKALDELFRVVKPNGYVIFRSPIMHRGFYNNIDHIRPYPPKSILQYFNYEQQQKRGHCRIKLFKEWTRREPFEINIGIRGVSFINLFLKAFWNRFGWPRGKASGYIAIFQKL